MIQRYVLGLVGIDNEEGQGVTLDELVERNSRGDDGATSGRRVRVAACAAAADAAAPQGAQAEADGQEMRLTFPARNVSEAGSDASTNRFRHGNGNPTAFRQV